MVKVSVPEDPHRPVVPGRDPEFGHAVVKGAEGMLEVAQAAVVDVPDEHRIAGVRPAGQVGPPHRQRVHRVARPGGGGQAAPRSQAAPRARPRRGGWPGGGGVRPGKRDRHAAAAARQCRGWPGRGRQDWRASVPTKRPCRRPGQVALRGIRAGPGDPHPGQDRLAAPVAHPHRQPSRGFHAPQRADVEQARVQAAAEVRHGHGRDLIGRAVRAEGHERARLAAGRYPGELGSGDEEKLARLGR